MLRYDGLGEASKVSSKSKTRHIYALDLLRISAAILVLLNHFAEFKLGSPGSSGDGNAAYGFIWLFDGVGSVGVEIFFVISGFVITASAERGCGKSFALRFAILRCKRLLPVLWISGLISLLARAYDSGYSSELFLQYIRYALLFPFGPYIDGVVWSLVVEAVFYALIGLIIFSADPRRFCKLAIVLSILSLIYNITYMAIYLSVDIYHSAAFAFINRFAFKVILLKYGIFFTLGMFIRSGIGAANLSVKYVLLPSILALCLAEIFTASLNLTPFSATIKCLIWLVGIACLLIGVKRDPLSSIKSRRMKILVKWLGAISYPIYLNHYTLGDILTQKLDFMGDVTRFTFILILIIALSHCVERIATRAVSMKFFGETKIVDKRT